MTTDNKSANEREEMRSKSEVDISISTEFLTADEYENLMQEIEDYLSGLAGVEYSSVVSETEIEGE